MASTIVYDQNGLSNALAIDNGIDYVYLGSDITMTAGIRVHPNKTSLIIDGQYPPDNTTLHRLTDAGYDAGQIYVNLSPSLEITFQNMNITGRNYFGMPYIMTYAGSENVTVNYRNVTYSGPQMIYHRRGLTRFIDCDVTITAPTVAEVHEIGEVCRVEIGGKTTMTKTQTNNSAFWFLGTSTLKPSFKILSGAEVTITTPFYFMYETNPPDFILEPNSRFDLNTGSGFSYTDAHTITSFQMGERSIFRYTQEANRGYASMYLAGPLTVGENASFYMQADFANTHPLLNLSGSTASMTMNNPRSFVLYNGGSNTSATAFQFGATTPFDFKTGQVNYWEAATAFPTAGTFDDPPLHKWNRLSWEAFTLRGTAATAQTNVTYNDFTQTELDDLPPLTDLKLQTAKVFSLGNLPLDIYSVILTRRITGKTAPYANVRVIYLPSTYEDPQIVVADEEGMFSIIPATVIPFTDYVEIGSNIPFLIVTEVAAARAEDDLYIESAPVLINYQTPPLAGFLDTVLPRDDTESPVTVIDTRDPKTPWQLWAKITGPLKTVQNDVLENAVVFALQDGSLLTLSTTYQPVHLDGPYPEDSFTVTWVEDKGILVRATSPIRCGRRYSTMLDWTVTPEGVSPEEDDNG